MGARKRIAQKARRTGNTVKNIRGMPAHSQRAYLPYSVEQLFDLVADVERYPEFLPWMPSCRIVERGPDSVSVEMLLELGPLQQRFHSRAVLERPKRIDISSSDSPFESFTQTWQFIPDGGHAVVEYLCDFTLRSHFLEAIVSPLMDEAIRATVEAFEQRARQVYGNAAAVRASH